MVSCTTHGVTVQVQTRFLPEHSNPRARKFVFGYHITITNLSQETVQLLFRNWIITEFGGQVRTVQGAGVINQQPVLEPGKEHEYMSYTILNMEMGKMSGFYTMQRLTDKELIKVEIPEFQLQAPVLFN